MTRTFPKAKKIDMNAPADLGQKPVRSKIFKRLCTDCKHYVTSEKYCPMVGKISNPEVVYCSWWKNKNEI